MEKDQTAAKIETVRSDYTLISNIQEENDEGSLLEIIDRHSGIFHTMVNQFMSHPHCSLDKSQLVGEKDSTIYSAALNYDPTRKTKFSTHLANQTKWKCLNILNKKKKRKEFQNCLKREKDERVKKIIDIRYGVDNNKLTPWRKIAEELDMSIQGCINIHNKFINKVKKEGNYV